MLSRPFLLSLLNPLYRVGCRAYHQYYSKDTYHCYTKAFNRARTTTHITPPAPNTMQSTKAHLTRI